MDTLNFAVIHSLQKDANTLSATTRLATGLLNVAQAEVVDLATQLARLVGKAGSTVYWGQFGSNNREGQFPSAVETLTADLSSEAFLRSTEIAMAELQTAAARELLSTGGHVCFLAYEAGGKSFLLVAMIKERGALTLDENLVPTGIKEIDLSKLHQAARVNLDRYAENLQRVEDDGAADASDERTYLCFVNRSGKADVAKYFINALGCEEGVSSARASRAAVDGVVQYFKARAETKAVATKVRRAVIDYMHGFPDNAEIELEGIARVAELALGPTLQSHASDLVPFLNGDDWRLPERFAVSAKYVKSVTRIVAKSTHDQWQMSFDDSALGESNAPLIYDRSDRTLKITDLPEATVARIEDTLANRAGPG